MEKPKNVEEFVSAFGDEKYTIDTYTEYETLGQLCRYDTNTNIPNYNIIDPSYIKSPFREQIPI